jgi:Arc/MetJ-type ribon-helix-helix transcriptional regulator
MTTQLALRLDDEQVRELDRLVVTWDDLVNRSEVVRLAIAEFIERRRRLEIDRQIIEGYTRVPQGDVDRWGDVDQQVAGHARSAAQRLDAEDGGWDAPW